MNRYGKFKKFLKGFTIFCIIILFVEVCYLVFTHFKRESQITYFDGLNQVEKTKDGYIGVGSSDFHSSNGNQYTKGYENAKIAFYDENYKLVWEKQYQSKYNSTFFSVSSVEDGYIAVGSVEDSKNQNKDSLRDALIVKYDKDGKELWKKTVQVISNAKFTKVRTVEDGFIVIGQSLFAPMDIGVAEGGGALIIKYNLEGEEQWRANYGGTKSGIFNDFLVSKDGYYVVGKDGYNTGILVKYSLDGVREWVKNYSYTDKIGFSAITEYQDELYIVGGKMENSEDSNLDTYGLLVKYDKNGKLLMEKTYQGGLMERYNGIKIDSKGNIIVIGNTAIKDSEASTGTENVFRYNGLLGKYDQKGKEIYVKEIGGTQDDYFNDLFLKENSYVVLSYTNSKNKDYKGQGNGKDFKTKFVTFTENGKIKEIK